VAVEGNNAAREHLDEIHNLRTAQDWVGVQRLADDSWRSWLNGEMAEPLGLGALCQTAFISALDVDGTQGARSDDSRLQIAATAQLWRARATVAAALNGELNTIAMLLLPIAFQAYSHGFPETTLAIFEEIAAVGDEIERRGLGDIPGVKLAVLRRVYHEKRGWLLWRLKRYEESKNSYVLALPFSPNPSRDRVRVEAGVELASLGVEEEASGHFNPRAAAERFRQLEQRARAGGWLDVAVRLGANAEGLEDGRIQGVQQLLPMEIEPLELVSAPTFPSEQG
jgi:hypothetical protein